MEVPEEFFVRCLGGTPVSVHADNCYNVSVNVKFIVEVRQHEPNSLQKLYDEIVGKSAANQVPLP